MEKKIEPEKMNLAEMMALIGPKSQRKENPLPEGFWNEFWERAQFADLAIGGRVDDLAVDVQNLSKRVDKLNKQLTALLKALNHVEVTVSLQKYVKLMGE